MFVLRQRDFIMQAGDPTGTGRGGESIYRSVYCSTFTAHLAAAKPLFLCPVCCWSANYTETRPASLTRRKCRALSTESGVPSPWWTTAVGSTARRSAPHLLLLAPCLSNIGPISVKNLWHNDSHKKQSILFQHFCPMPTVIGIPIQIWIGALYQQLTLQIIVLSSN